MAEVEHVPDGVPIVSTTGILAEAQEKIDEHTNSATTGHAIPTAQATILTTEVELTPVREALPDTEAGAIRPEDTVVPTEVVEIPSQQAQAELSGSVAAPAPATVDNQQDGGFHFAPGQFADEQDLEADVRRIPRSSRRRRRLIEALSHMWVITGD